MSTGRNDQDKPFDHLPEDLLGQLRRETDLESIVEVAAFDLDRNGRYTEGELILTDSRLGHYVRQDGRWRGQWIETSQLGGAKIVEGLGMNLLRLLRDGKVLEEFRFTLRHAKTVAKLQRRLERRISGKEEDPAVEVEAPKPDEKKLRCEKCGRVIPSWAETCPACLSKRKVLSRLLDFVRPYKWSAIASFGLAVFVTLTMLCRPLVTRPILNRGLGLKAGFKADYGVLMFYVGILMALTILATLGGAIQMRLLARLGSRIARDIRDRTYGHLHKLSLSFFSKKRTGSIVTRITSDSDRIWDFVAFTLVDASMAFLTLIGVVFLLFYVNWKLACFVMVPIPVMLGLTLFFHKKMHGFFRRMWHRWSHMTAIVADAIPGVRVIKAFSQEKREVDRFMDSNAQYYEGEMTMITLWTTFGPAIRFCSQLGSLIIWTLGGYWAVQTALAPEGAKLANALYPGDLMAYIGYMWMFYGPVHQISHMDRRFNRAATSVQRIFEILDTEPAVFSKTKSVQPTKLQGRIELKNVSFSYDGVRRVLKDINLEIPAGKMIGLAGPSGAGKSTMINLICRFYDVLEGQILIDGVDVRDYDIEALRRRIGVVLQEPFLFHGTIAQNIAYGNPEANIDQIIEAAKAANAHDFIVGFPDGYDTLVGERGQSLSGGERQRISIARAVLNNPTILILDEATSSVDTETEKLIQEAIDRLVANRTTIAIAHRLSTLRKADRLVVLDKGQIVEQGTHEELVGKEDGLYAKLLRMQAETQSLIAIA